MHDPVFRLHTCIRLAGIALVAFGLPCSVRAAKPPRSRPSTGSVLRLVAAPRNDSPSVEPRYDAAEDSPGALLESIDQQNRLVTDLLETEVEHALREARASMSANPEGVEQTLKLELSRVLGSPELSPETRARLRRQLEAALRESARVANTKDILDRQREDAQAAALDRQRIANELVRKEEKIEQLMDRFNSLMAEGRYVAADEIGEVEIARLAPNCRLRNRPVSRLT